MHKAKKIKEPENSFRDLFEIINDLIQSVNIRGKFVYVNRKWRKTLGYSDKDVKKLTLKDILRKDQIPHCMKIFKKVCRGEKFENIEAFFITKKGKEIPVSGNVAPFFKNGKFVATSGIFRDVTERKKAEEELKKNKKILQVVFEHSQDALYKRNLRTGKYEYMSPAITKITGYTPGEVMAMSPKKIDFLIHPEDLKRINKIRQGILNHPQKNKIIDSVEYRVKCKNGKYKWVSDHYTLIMGPNGLPMFSIASLRDITERKKVESLLHIKDAAISSSINAIAIADLKGNLTYVNNSFLRMWGYGSDKEVIGKPALNFWHSKEKATEVIKTLHNKRGWVGEMNAIKKDGSLFDAHLSANIITDENSKPIYMMASFVDITKRKKVEKELRRNEERLKEAQSVAHVGNWNWDVKRNKLSWSDEIYRIFGLNPQEFGATYEAFLNSVHPNDREFVKKSVSDALYERKPYSIDHRILLSDGSERIVHEEAKIFYKSGKPVRMLGTVQDITDRKRMEEDLKKSRKELEEKIKELEKFSKISIGRELKMVELKKKVKELQGKK